MNARAAGRWPLAAGRWGAIMAVLMMGAMAAEDAPGVPTAGPVPRLAPQVPGKAEEPTPAQRLLLRLNQLIEAHDRRIAALSAQVPAAARLVTSNDPVLDLPRRERDQALQEFRRAVEAFGSQHPDRQDPLDVARPAAKAEQAGPIAVTNLLRIAECYQELVQGAGGTAEDREAGVQVLTACDVKQLPAIEQPRWWYLKVWFAAERARHATGDERAKRLAEAQEAQSLMAAAFPNLELTAAAKLLTLDLNPEPVPVPAPPAGPVP